MSTPTKPGWVDVPGKGRRYWTGSEYRFYGPSDDPASKGQPTLSGDIAGMWNNFVGQYGKSTNNSKQVGAQNMTSAEAKAEIERRKKAGGGGTKDSKTPPTAQPPSKVKPSASLSIPPSAAQPGTGPKNNTVGSDSDPDETGLQGPGDPKGPPGSARVNANGLVSYGKDLSSLNQFTKAFTGGYEVADIETAFQSEDLPGAYQTGSNKINPGQTAYELPEGAAPSPLDKGLAGAEGLTMQDTGYTIGESSVPGTVGRSGSAQEGSSSKPDIAEEVRTIRMNRNSGRGSRRDPRNRGEDADMFGGPEPSDASLVSPMYANAKRNKIRSTFLDHEGSSVQAAAAANAVAGYGKDSNADARFNVGGELVYAKEGMQQKAKNAAMMGKDPREFLDIPTTPDTQPDSPAASEISMTAPIKDMNEEQQKRAATEFAKGFVSDISSKLKDK